MNKHLGKIVICMSFFIGTVSAMNLQRDAEWRCTEHTKSKTALARLAMIELTLSGTVVYMGLKDSSYMQYLFGAMYKSPAELVVAGGTADQRLALTESQNSDARCLKCLGFSGILLCDAGSTLWKIRNYQQYLQQKHEDHECLTGHRH